MFVLKITGRVKLMSINCIRPTKSESKIYINLSKKYGFDHNHNIDYKKNILFYPILKQLFTYNLYIINSF